MIALRLSSLAFVAVLLIPLALAAPPAEAEAPASARSNAPSSSQRLLLLAAHPEVATTRDAYEVTSKAEMLRLAYTRTYSTTWTGPIRWPFPETVPISSGFGYRPAPCRGCSTDHRAVDFAPGGGIPIYAIADGVVKDHVDGNGSWGNYVIIEHRIDGKTVTSSYAHMQRGSSPLVAGQRIAVGDYIGLVGATGQATGKHLHLEIKVGEVKVDPFEWLTARAG